MPRGPRVDSTSDRGIKAAGLTSKIELVEETCLEAGEDIYDWLMKCVAFGIGFPTLEKQGIPCGRDYFYERYRRYFYLLDKKRD